MVATQRPHPAPKTVTHALKQVTVIVTRNRFCALKNSTEVVHPRDRDFSTLDFPLWTFHSGLSTLDDAALGLIRPQTNRPDNWAEIASKRRGAGLRIGPDLERMAAEF